MELDMTCLKYEKIPVTIYAIEWTGKNLDEVMEFADGCATYEAVASGGGVVVVQTLESNGELKTRHAASVGDYIIKGVKGEFYPCTSEVFKLTYKKL